jgi:membrane protease YdiL (CAAX protease family)
MQPGSPPAPQFPGGWYRDPWQQADWRWFDGRSWTSYVSGPAHGSGHGDWRTRPATATLPLGAALSAIAVLVGGTVVDRALTSLVADSAAPDAVLGVLAFAVYGALAAATFLIVKRACPAISFEEAVGAKVRTVDIAWGFLWMITARVASVIVGVIIVVGGVPFRRNLPYDPHTGRFRPPVSMLVVLIVIAVVVAPIVEEIVFRGVILRGLRSRMAMVPAVLIQGLLFGASHASLAYGAGNIGLILVLSAIGIVFGFASEYSGRLGPTMWAHALVNAGAIALAWFLLS